MERGAVMSFLQDKGERYFFICIILFTFLIIISDIVLCAKQRDKVQEMLITHDGAIVSSLLEQDIEENVIAKAITNRERSQAGIEFMDKLGLTVQTDAVFISNVKNFQVVNNIRNLFKNLILSVYIMGTVLIFIIKRENVYKSAIRKIDNYIKGDFSESITELSEGTIYKLFNNINNMAFMLKSKQEAEHKTKEFLKNTISDISHQLKTPLTALAMYNEIILEEPENSDSIIKFAEKAKESIERIEGLIGSLLKITRLDSNSIKFEKSIYEIREIVFNSIKELIVRAENEDKEIIIQESCNEKINCDLQWTSEAIGNIVKNALDHTESGGKVYINWENKQDMIHISISDNGTGIEEEDFHHIFKRFYRSKNSFDTKGVGLGLPLAKSIVEGQGGIISVDSVPNKGTTFMLSFLT